MASTTRWGGLRLEPYNPDAVDADNDGIVQEGTAWERPAGARLFDELGRAILRGATASIRPAGLQYRDRSGKDITYAPKVSGPAPQSRPGKPDRLGRTIGQRRPTLSALGFGGRQHAAIGRVTPNITDQAHPPTPPLPADQQAIVDSYEEMRARVEAVYGPITTVGQAHAALDQAFPNLLLDHNSKISHFDFNHEWAEEDSKGRLDPHEEAYVYALLDCAIDHPEVAASFVVLTNKSDGQNQGLTQFGTFGIPGTDGISHRPALSMNLHPDAGLTKKMRKERNQNPSFTGIGIEPALRAMVKSKRITRAEADKYLAAYVATHEFGHGVQFHAMAADMGIDLADISAGEANYRRYAYAIWGQKFPDDLHGSDLSQAFDQWWAGLSDAERQSGDLRFQQVMKSLSWDDLSQDQAKDLYGQWGTISDYALGNSFEGFAEMFAAERIGLADLPGPAAKKMRNWAKHTPKKPVAKPASKPPSSGLGRLGISDIGATGKIGEMRRAVQRPAPIPEGPKPYIPAKPVLTGDEPSTGLATYGPDDIVPPTFHDLEMGVVLWREGQTEMLRSELDNVLAGPDAEWEGIPEDRAQMAALLNATADAPLTTKPLFRGEMIWDKGRFDELVATLKPGATFTTDLRGYGSDQGTALMFAIGAPQQVIYEVEPGARAVRLADVVPVSRHRDDDILEAGAEELTDELFENIADEDEHLAMGKYEVVSVKLEDLPGILGNPSKQRLVVKVRQTEALSKPAGGWDAPLSSEDHVVSGAVGVLPGPTTSRPAPQLGATGSKGPADITTPTTHDLDMGAVYWRQGEPRQMRDHLEHVLAGRDEPWDGNPADRARMAALMNAVADAPTSIKPLYRGEAVTPSEFDEVAARLVRGATFTTDMRGYAPNRGTAQNFAQLHPTPDTTDQIMFEVEPGARALRLADAVPMQRHHDPDVVAALAADGWKPLDYEMLSIIGTEDEHIALGTYEVTDVQIETIEPDYFNGLKAPARRLVVKVRQTEALGKPEGGWDAPQAPPVPEAEPSMASRISDALAAVAAEPNRGAQLYQIDVLLQRARDSKLPGWQALVAALEAERDRLRDLPNPVSDLVDPHDPQVRRTALQKWTSRSSVEMRRVVGDLLKGPDSLQDRPAYNPNSSFDISYNQYLHQRSWMAALLNHYSDDGRESTVPLFRGFKGLPGMTAEKVMSDLYPEGKEFVMPPSGFSTSEDIAQRFAGQTGSTGTAIILRIEPGAKALSLPDLHDRLRAEDGNTPDFMDPVTVKRLTEEQEHLVAGTLRVVKREILPDGRVLVTLQQVTPLEPPEGGTWR